MLDWGVTSSSFLQPGASIDRQMADNMVNVIFFMIGSLILERSELEGCA
jgi:hypothetical protein